MGKSTKSIERQADTDREMAGAMFALNPPHLDYCFCHDTVCMGEAWLCSPWVCRNSKVGRISVITVHSNLISERRNLRPREVIQFDWFLLGKVGLENTSDSAQRSFHHTGLSSLPSTLFRYNKIWICSLFFSHTFSMEQLSGHSPTAPCKDCWPLRCGPSLMPSPALLRLAFCP